MYDIVAYGAMIADAGRTDAYAQALRARIAPGSVVLDIGAGPGILTLLACQAGARKVYAVELDGVIQVAREAVEANGFADRVEFIQALSTEITLPEKVDLVVADIHGVFPLFGGSASSILDARDRLLKPGGIIIPEQEVIYAALVNAPAIHGPFVGPWQNKFGLDYSAARHRSVNTWCGKRLPAETLVVEPQVWTVLDYSRLQSPSVKGEVTWTVARACVAHGLGLWFDCFTAPGLSFSNSPAAEEHIFRQGFFPWPEACRLEIGDEVSVEIRADVVGGDYVWSWNTEIRGPEGTAKAQFRQSQFLGAPLSSDLMRKSGSAFVPSPKPEAAIDHMILQLFSEGINLEEISRRVADRFPDRFPKWRKALTRVGEMSLRYSE